MSRLPDRTVFGPQVAPAHAALILLGLGWSLPFLWPYRPLPLGAFYSECLAFGFGLAALPLLLTRSAQREFRIPTVALGLIVLAGLFLLQSSLGRVPYAGDAHTAARYLAWAALLATLGVQLRRDLGADAIARLLAWFLFLGGMLGALTALVQLYRWDTPLNFAIARADAHSAYGNIGQPAQFAAYMALATASAGYLHARGALRGWMTWPAAALFVFVLALTGRRTVWLYLGLLAVLAVALHRRAPGADSARLRAYAVLLLPAFFAAQWLIKLPYLQIPEAVVESGERLFEVASGVGPRAWLAQVAWGMFSANPLLGAGLGQFAVHNFEATADLGGHPLVGLTRNAHNIVLHLLAESGVAGAGILVGLVGIWLLDLRRATFDMPSWWLLALLGVLGIYSMLEYPLWYAYFLGIAAVLMGIGAARTFAIDARLGSLLVAGAIAFGGYLLLMSALHYRGFERAIYSSRVLPPAERDAVVARQLERNRDDPHLAPYVELIVSRSMDVSERRLDEKLRLNTRVMHFAPVSHVVYRQAMLLALAGDFAGAGTQLRRAAKVYPAGLTPAIQQLRDLAARHPEKLEPLLRLAVAEAVAGEPPLRAR